MKISVGWFRAENGTKWHVDYVNDKWAVGHSSNGGVAIWDSTGSAHNENGHLNLVDPWTDPVPWDWSTTPPWLFWLFQKESGGWLLSDFKPVLMEHGHGWKTAGYVVQVPADYSPKWSGDWKQSLTVRPGYKENSK